MSHPRCLAVMYHYVRDRRDGALHDIRGLDEAAFRSQLDLLCSSLEPVDWPTFGAWSEGRRSLPADSFILTFDDGLSDHAEVVCPILESFGLRGVFLVSTGPLSDGRMLSAHAVHLLLCAMGEDALFEAVMSRAAECSGGSADCRTVDGEAARAMYHYETPRRAELKYLLTQVLPPDLCEGIIAELFGRHVGDAAEHSARWYASADDLCAMQAAGHTIGGHGHDHVPYARLTPSRQAADMGRCASILRERFGSARRPFSYPYGSVDETIGRGCALNGFVNGFTTQAGWIGADDDPHRIRRVDTINVDTFVEREMLCREA